jgi:hypothetical protein
LTSQLPTIFYILNSLNFTSGNPAFYIILANLLAAVYESSGVLAPVQTILPKI